MTTTKKVHDLILKLKKGKLAPEALKPGAKMKEVLGLDSLSLTELVVLTEESFAMKFSDQEIQSVKTVGQLVELIDRRLAAA